MWKISSPGKKLEIKIKQDKRESVFYEVYLNHKICAEGRLGIDTSLADFTGNIQFISADNVEEINEQYRIPAGKKDIYINHCMEAHLHFVKSDVPLVITVRAYDNGAAFCYEIPSGERIFW